MPRQIAQAAAWPVRALWRITGKPIYQRLVRVYFVAIINRLNSTLGELTNARAELVLIRAEISETRARQDELDRHIRNVVATYWDTTALARRLATLEDRMGHAESGTQHDSTIQDGANGLEGRAAIALEQDTQ
jgi:hypothetical protein